MLLPSKDIVGYISSMPIYFDCHVILQQNEEYHHLQFLLGKNVHASDYDPVVETFFIDFNTIRILSEVMVDYVSVSLFCCCCFCLFFIFGSFVPKFVNVFYCSFFFIMYMREKNEIAFAHFENCFRMQLIHLM